MTQLHLTQRRGAVIVGASLLTGLIGALLWLRPRRFVVSGDSMLPTLRPGDRLLVARLGHAKQGEIVVVRDPRSPSRLICKRVVSADARHIVVRGDNPDASTDSRAFGPVPVEWVVGRVLRRYYPRGEERLK
jgi:inner membrane protease subunit 1